MRLRFVSIPLLIAEAGGDPGRLTTVSKLAVRRRFRLWGKHFTTRAVAPSRWTASEIFCRMQLPSGCRSPTSGP